MKLAALSFRPGFSAATCARCSRALGLLVAATARTPGRSPVVFCRPDAKRRRLHARGGILGAGTMGPCERTIPPGCATGEQQRRVKVRWGMLLHERFNDPEAADLFREALSKDQSNAEAYLGLARVSEGGFDGKAASYAARQLSWTRNSLTLM